MLIREVKSTIEAEFQQGIARDSLLITKVILDGGGTLRSSIIITDDISMISGGNSVSVQKFSNNVKIQLSGEFGVMSILENISRNIRDNGTEQTFIDAYISLEDNQIEISQANVNQTNIFLFNSATTYYIEYEALSISYSVNKKYGTVSIWTV